MATAKQDALVTALVAVIDERFAALATAPAPAPVPTPTPTPVPLPPPPAASPLLSTFIAKMSAATDVMEQPTSSGKTFASASYWTSSYYDVTERCLELYELTGNARYLTAAKREGARFRSNIVWTGDRCIPRFPSDDDDPNSPPLTYAPPQVIHPSLLRRNGAKGQWKLFAMTGDPEARRAALGSAAAMLAALPAYLVPTGSPPFPRIEWTERNLSYMIGAFNAGARLDPAKYAAPLASLVKRAVAWNARSSAGNFEHDARQDPGECWSDAKNGPDMLPTGGSAFMSALLCYELWDAAPQDAGVRNAIVRVSNWLAANRTRDVNEPEGTLSCYWYQPGCLAEPKYEWWHDLNPMIAPVHELATRITGDPKHRAICDTMLAIGIKESSGKSDPKHWSQLALAARRWIR